MQNELPCVLPEGETHVWNISLDVTDEELAGDRKLLSGDELARADRLRHWIPRKAFTVTRAALRRILARYLQRDPHTVAFSYGPYGKPMLCGASLVPQLMFNTSHSAGHAVVALVRGRRIGVDIERLGAIRNPDRLAREIFSASEFDQYSQLSAEAAQLALLRAWTCKEAYLKGTGLGHSIPMSNVEVAFLPHESPRLLGVRVGNSEAHGHWLLEVTQPTPGCLLALAVEHDESIAVRQFGFAARAF